MPHPFTNFVVKIHELCNINCTYCYMYNLKDTSYKGRPKYMSEETRDIFFQRLITHVKTHKIETVVIFLHGGEPLLVKKDYFDRWATELFGKVGQFCNVLLRVQTNAILIDDEWIEIFNKYSIRLGISLDGPKDFNDRYRITKDGKGTFDNVIESLNKIKQHPLGENVFGSILSVANPQIPARQMWEFWMNTQFTRFDFNLPHCTHDNPPWFSIPELSAWMIELFELWWTNDNPNYDIRFFRNIVQLILGADFSTDYIGGKPVGIVVIETDGSIQGTDALRACENEMTNINMNLYENELDDALDIPLVQLSNYSSSELSDKCMQCRVKEVCGGGYLAHRYSRKNKFNNPSVYCDALYSIIDHIHRRIVKESGGIFQEALNGEVYEQL